jgi:hypothetical protein
MKKKLIRVANQIYALEEKIQIGENIAENMEKMESLTESLSSDELWEVNNYLEEKMKRRPL